MIKKYFNKKNVIASIVLVFIVLVVIVSFYLYQQKQEKLYQEYINQAEALFEVESEINDDSIDDSIENDIVINLTKAIKINPEKETGYTLRAYTYFINHEPDLALQDINKVLSMKGQRTASILKLQGDVFKMKQELDKATESYKEAYKIDSTDKDIVHEYVGSLLYYDKGEEAYPIISKYFNETDKDIYWNDVDLWADRAMASFDVNRCLEAFASAWHVNAITEDGDDLHNFAKATMYQALTSKECMKDEGFTK